MSIETTPNCKWAGNPHLFDATDHCARCGERRKDAEGARLARDERQDALMYALKANPGIAPPPESPADRILRVARDAGYRPTHYTADGSLVQLHIGEGPNVKMIPFAPSESDDHVRWCLNAYAGPANQPAPKAEPMCEACGTRSWTLLYRPGLSDQHDVYDAHICDTCFRGEGPGGHDIVGAIRANRARALRPKPALTPLDFVAVRDATVAITDVASAKVVSGERVTFAPHESGKTWSIATGYGHWFAYIGEEVARVHAELSALADEAMRAEMGEGATPTEPNAYAALKAMGDEVAKQLAEFTGKGLVDWGGAVTYPADDELKCSETMHYWISSEQCLCGAQNRANSPGFSVRISAADPYNSDDAEAEIAATLGGIRLAIVEAIDDIVELRGAKLNAKDRADLDDVPSGACSFADFRRDFGWLVAMLAREGGRV